MITNGQETQSRSDDLSGLTDKELDRRRLDHKANAGLDTEVKPDLEQLQRDERAEHRRSRFEGMSWLERTVQQAKELFTGGPEAQYKSMVREAERLYSSIQRRNDGIEAVLDEKSEELSSLDSRLEDTKMYAKTSMEQYQRSTRRRQRLEEELEQLKQSDQYTPDVREKREQVRLVRKEQRELYRETSVAMSALKRFNSHRAKTEQQYDDLSEKVSAYREQEDALGIQLHEWRLQQELRFPDEGQSVRELYEDIGILSQRIQRFVEHDLPTYKSPEINKDYALEFGTDEEDPLLVEWNKTPSP